MMREGSDSVVTAIMNASTVPSCAPFHSSASATGMVPKMSAYIGTPTAVANRTPSGLSPPRIRSIHVSGIQLWMTAPMPAPIRLFSYFMPGT